MLERHFNENNNNIDFLNSYLLDMLDAFLDGFYTNDKVNNTTSSNKGDVQ